VDSRRCGLHPRGHCLGYRGHGHHEASNAFYLAAIVATLPSCLILYPVYYSVVVVVALAIGVGVDGSGPAWVLLPAVPLGFGVAAALNVILLRLVVYGIRSRWARRRRPISRTTA
jgi:hypothetical protein